MTVLRNICFGLRLINYLPQSTWGWQSSQLQDLTGTLKLTTVSKERSVLGREADTLVSLRIHGWQGNQPGTQANKGAASEPDEINPLSTVSLSWSLSLTTLSTRESGLNLLGKRLEPWYLVDKQIINLVTLAWIQAWQKTGIFTCTAETEFVVIEGVTTSPLHLRLLDTPSPGGSLHIPRCRIQYKVPKPTHAVAEEGVWRFAVHASVFRMLRWNTQVCPEPRTSFHNDDDSFCKEIIHFNMTVLFCLKQAKHNLIRLRLLGVSLRLQRLRPTPWWERINLFDMQLVVCAENRALTTKN